MTEEEKEKKRAKAREDYQRRKATKGKEIIPDGMRLFSKVFAVIFLKGFTFISHHIS